MYLWMSPEVRPPRPFLSMYRGELGAAGLDALQGLGTRQRDIQGSGHEWGQPPGLCPGMVSTWAVAWLIGCHISAMWAGVPMLQVFSRVPQNGWYRISATCNTVSSILCNKYFLKYNLRLYLIASSPFVKCFFFLACFVDAWCCGLPRRSVLGSLVQLPPPCSLSLKRNGAALE